jgi:acyl-CoA synthetase (AMP-forming)/AMP-acid ligase II
MFLITLRGFPTAEGVLHYGLYTRLQAHGAARPEGRAITLRQRGGDVVWTWAELARQAQQWATALVAADAPGTVVPILAERTPHTIAAMLGALGAGAAFSCLNPKLRAPQVAQVLAATGARVALVDGRGLLSLKGATAAQLEGPAWWRLGEAAWSTLHHKKAARFPVALVDPGLFDPLDGQANWPKDARAVVPAEPAIDAERTGCCLFTSGSTGVPKGVRVGAQDLRARAQAEVAWYELTPADRLLNLLPFSFDVGLNQVCSAIEVGCELVLSPSWLPADVLKTVAELGITGVSGVPGIWQDVLAQGLAFDAEVHASLRYITVSGGDLAPSQRDALPAMAGPAGIYKTYGQTEAFRASSLHPSEFASRPGSVGRAFGDVRLYVVDESGAPLGANASGQVVHTGLGAMLGYVDGIDRGKRRPNPFVGPDDGHAWAIFTGDQGHLDAEGYLFLQGRRDGMLKINGNRVYPAEVEGQLAALDGVDEAVVLGFKGAPDQMVAFVKGAGLEGVAVRRAVARLLPGYMVPARVEVLAVMPRTASGKPDRPALRQRCAT